MEKDKLWLIIPFFLILVVLYSLVCLIYETDMRDTHCKALGYKYGVDIGNGGFYNCCNYNIIEEGKYELKDECIAGGRYDFCKFCDWIFLI